MPLTYRDAGVDIDAGNDFVRRIAPFAKATRRPGVLDSIGGFGGLFGLREAGFDDPILVSGTDGVGTKLRVAFLADSHDTVGIDLVAMCVNDVLTLGATPLFFLDYFATGKLDADVATDVVKGIADGCKQAGCALLGGETAEMPGMYSDGEYDLAGFCVGAVERGRIVSPEHVRAGDVLVGLRSSGIHSNGYSLARRALLVELGMGIHDHVEVLGRPLSAALLEPTRIYTDAVVGLLKDHFQDIHGLAHITGGGLVENVPRVLPEGLVPNFNFGAWEEPPIFDLIRSAGVPEDEMRRTFNLGIGFVFVVASDAVESVVEKLKALGEAPEIIGTVEASS
jgi:phosphoribosylformylglycinamidine cyclo-ligase